MTERYLSDTYPPPILPPYPLPILPSYLNQVQLLEDTDSLMALYAEVIEEGVNAAEERAAADAALRSEWEERDREIAI